MAEKEFSSLEEIAQYFYKKFYPDHMPNKRPEDQPKGKDAILLFAHNATGKTRLSTIFKNSQKKRNEEEDMGEGQTLYYNAFTEDLFHWDNDLESDREFALVLNTDSKFFNMLYQGYDFEKDIREYLGNYANFEFKIDLSKHKVNFWYKFSEDSDGIPAEFVKLSRAEESIFIWCFFLAIVRLAIIEANEYRWVKYLYIDDPVSSLDEENLIRRACELAEILCPVKNEENGISGKFCALKTIISSHNLLFLKVLESELGRKKTREAKFEMYSFARLADGRYVLNGSPKAEHLACLDILEKAKETRELYTWHFNILRSVLEKTAAFHGHNDFGWCLENMEDEMLFNRLLNNLSHGKYSVYSPMNMTEDNKRLFGMALEYYKNRFGVSSSRSEVNGVIGE